MTQNLDYMLKFDFNGIVTAVRTNNREWLQAFKTSVNSSPVSIENHAELNVDLIDVSLHELDRVVPLPQEAFKIDETKVLLDQLVTISSYQQDEQSWQEIEGYARIHIDYARGWGALYRFQERWINNPFFADSFFAVNLVQKLMSCRQFYTIHASSVEINGKGVVITGPGGRGKSTSCYALARKGHPVLNDEKILLTFNKSYRACSITDIIKLRKNAIERFFPELLEIEPIYRPDQDEYCYKAGIRSGMKTAVECNADILIVLNQVDKPQSTARKINPARVVGELFPVTLNPRSIKSNTEKFEFLTDFLQQVTCYQIDFGYDMDRFASLIEDLA